MEDENKLETGSIVHSGKAGMKWGNAAGSMRWLHLFNNNIFTNTTLGFTHYDYHNYSYYQTRNLNDNSIKKDDFDLLSGVNDVLLKNDTEIPLGRLNIRAGGAFTLHNYIPIRIDHTGKSTAGNSDGRVSASDLSAYAEFEYHITKKIGANTGIRTGAYFTGSEIFPLLEPRVVLNYLFLPSYSLKASFSSMHQNMHLLTNSNLGLPSDIWVPSTKTIKPERSNQFSIGMAGTGTHGCELSIDFYYKSLRNLIEYKEGILIYGNTAWEDKIEKNGSGKVRGMEILLNKKKGSLTGWIAYTLSSNTRFFPNLNNGREFPFKYAQKHNISIVANYQLKKNFMLSVVWMYNSGNRITLPSGKYLLYASDNNAAMGFEEVHVYTEKNGYSMPDYHRMDAGLTRTIKTQKNTRIWSFNIFNLYNRQNAYYLFYKKDKKTGQTKLYQRSLFPLLVNIGYTYKF